jgi:GH18 family chitinase
MPRTPPQFLLLTVIILVAVLVMTGGFLQKIKDAGQAQLAKLEDHSRPQGSASSYQQPGQQQSGYYQQNQTPAQAPVGSIAQGGSTGKMNIGHFTNWSIYGRKYLVSKIPAQSLTHILYAFADVRDDGEVFLTDSWADVEIHYEGDSWNDSGKNMYGCLKQLLLLKKQHRHLKLLLSIGGWTYSSHFKAVKTPAGRSKFVSSATKILEDVGLDGLDIDWEYPANSEEANQYVQLLAELRSALNARERAVQGRHWLSIAAPCGEQMRNLHIREMDGKCIRAGRRGPCDLSLCAHLTLSLPL